MRWLLVGMLVLIGCSLSGVWVTWPRFVTDPAAKGVSLADFQRGMQIDQPRLPPSLANSQAGPAALDSVAAALAPTSEPVLPTASDLPLTPTMPNTEIGGPPPNDPPTSTTVPSNGPAQAPSGTQLQTPSFPRGRVTVTYHGEERSKSAAPNPLGRGHTPRAKAVHRSLPTNRQRSQTLAERHDPAAHAEAVHVAISR